MPLVLSKLRRWSEAGARLRPWIAGAVAMASLGGGYALLVRTGRRKIPDQPPAVSRIAMSAGQRRLSDDIGEWERRFQRRDRAKVPDAAAIAQLERAVEQQQRLLRLNPLAGIEQNVRLERLVAARDTARAGEARVRIDGLESSAEQERRAGRPGVALDQMRAALQLQCEIDNSHADANEKDFARERGFVRAIQVAEAEPVFREFETAMQQARVATAAQRWSEALAAYGRARGAQLRLNHDYPRTPFTNWPVLDEIEAEIASLNAAGLAAEIDACETSADAAADRGRTEEAAVRYRAASDLQRSLNAQFARSRFVSTARLEEMEIKRQTVLAAERLTAAAALDRAAAQALLKRQVLAAERKIGDATTLLAGVEQEFPKTRNFDGALKIRLAFLGQRRADLRTLQDRIYDGLVPVPDATNLLMLRTELPQDLYAKVMSLNPSRNAGGLLPVDSVNWDDAQEFCRRLSWLLGARVRLPTEREYRAALGEGDSTAWGAEAAAGRSREIGKQPANDAGFCDLTGNLAEWLQPEPDDSPTAPVAGGSYLDAMSELKKMPVVSIDKNERARHIGFRVVLELALE